MNEDRNVKPNYNDPKYNHAYYSDSKDYENTYGLPNYEHNRDYTNSFYEDNENSGAGSFLVGALVGGVIGAATALFLAPKSGSEMRGNLTTQASQLKDKSIEISSVAKGKATEFTSVAKEKTGELSKTIQEQSGQLVDKVKSMTSKTSVPMDDGTASSEGEESIDFTDNRKTKLEDAYEAAEETLTVTAEAIQKAVMGNANDAKKASTGNSGVAYNNSENVGEDSIINQNAVSEVIDKK